MTISVMMCKFNSFFRYPNYEFISDNSISWSAGLHNRYTENSLRGVILDIHFLSQADFLVCTFSSQVSGSRTFLFICLKSYLSFKLKIKRAGEYFQLLVHFLNTCRENQEPEGITVTSCRSLH